MKIPFPWKLHSRDEKPHGHTPKNLVPFLILSLILHGLFLGAASWTASKAPLLIPTKREEKPLAKKKTQKKKEKKKEREKLVYVKILNIPKPPKEEKPKKAHIIAQYSMKKKGPRGKQERSSISGESSSLNFRPGLPITPPKPRITLVPGQQPLSPPKLEAKKGTRGKGEKAQKKTKVAKKGERKTPPPQKAKGQKKGKAPKGEKLAKKEGQKSLKKRAQKKASKTKRASKGQKREKLVRVMPQTGPQTQIIPPFPRRKIPLFDPFLINEQSNKIVPQMGKGQSQEISLDTTNSKYISYFKHIRDKLYLVWRYPLEARMSGIQGMAYILFVIDRSGQLKEVKLLKSSGFSILDKEAERALRAAAPFGPFPPDWPDKELRIRARFIYRLFSSPFR